MCSVRQNSLTNYKRLPIWFVTVGQLFQLCMYGLLLYQQIYLQINPDEDPRSSWANFIKVLYVIGLCSPVLNWVFIYFLIVRMNERVRMDTDPNFLDSQDKRAEDADERIVN